MKPTLTPMKLQIGIFYYFKENYPELIRLVTTLMALGKTPDEIEKFAEDRIGVCEISITVKIIAEYLAV